MFEEFQGGLHQIASKRFLMVLFYLTRRLLHHTSKWASVVHGVFGWKIKLPVQMFSTLLDNCFIYSYTWVQNFERIASCGEGEMRCYRGIFLGTFSSSSDLTQYTNVQVIVKTWFWFLIWRISNETGHLELAIEP